MNGLRLIATVLAYVIGLGGAVLSLINLPWSALTSASRPPDYVWSNLAVGVILPLSLCLAIATAILLIVRIDRRLELLEQVRDA